MIWWVVLEEKGPAGLGSYQLVRLGSEFLGGFDQNKHSVFGFSFLDKK